MSPRQPIAGIGMSDAIAIQPVLATHGADRLPSVFVDNYNVIFNGISI